MVVRDGGEEEPDGVVLQLQARQHQASADNRHRKEAETVADPQPRREEHQASDYQGAAAAYLGDPSDRKEQTAGEGCTEVTGAVNLRRSQSDSASPGSGAT